MGGGLIHATPGTQGKLVIPHATNLQIKKVVKLVESILELHKRLPKAKTDQEKTVLQRQIETTDREIDRLVYELYGLTEEEIRIVGGGATK